MRVLGRSDLLQLFVGQPVEQRAAWEAKFLDVQRRGFVPAGRINSAAGTSLAATLINWLSHQKNRPPEGTVGRGSHPQADRINKRMDQ